VIDRDLAIGQEGEAAKNILDNELIAQTTAWANDQVIYLSPSDWYVVMGGTGAIQEMVDEINAALPAPETEATPDATPEAEATSQG
jgi:iron complex transport system substrate-binding protein